MKFDERDGLYLLFLHESFDQVELARRQAISQRGQQLAQDDTGL